MHMTCSICNSMFMYHFRKCMSIHITHIYTCITVYHHINQWTSFIYMKSQFHEYIKIYHFCHISTYITYNTYIKSVDVYSPCFCNSLITPLTLGFSCTLLCTYKGYNLSLTIVYNSISWCVCVVTYH